MCNRRLKMFEDFEFNPISAAAGLLGGGISLFVMSTGTSGLVWKLLTFIGSSIACYFVFDRIMSKG